MVKKVFNNKLASYPLSPNLPHKTVWKDGKQYVLINNDPIKVSPCTSLVKAIGLTLLTACSFGGALASKSFRTSLFDNWRGIFKGNRIREVYELAIAQRKSTSLSGASQDSNNKAASATRSQQPKPVKTSTTGRAKKKQQAARTRKQAPAKAPNFKLPQKEILYTVYNGLLSEKFASVDDLEGMRVKVLNWLQDRSYQSTNYGNHNPDQAFIDSNAMREANLPFDTYFLQATLRYMLLKGDIVAYEPSRVGFRLALTAEGFKQFNPSDTLPITKDLLHKIQNEMKKFKRPSMPKTYSQEEGKLWNDALDAIERELYSRNLRATPKNKAVVENGAFHKGLFHTRVYDDLVRAGTIVEWNVTPAHHTPTMKIGTGDQVELNSYIWPKWRDIDVIKAT